MRASGVFTGTTNSPSRSPRQSIYHSTIRAGRNLPDKEFRSVSPTLFPEKPDFIFRVLCSLLKLFPVFLRCLPLSRFSLVYQVEDFLGPRRCQPLSLFELMVFKTRYKSFR